MALSAFPDPDAPPSPGALAAARGHAEGRDLRLERGPGADTGPQLRLPAHKLGA